MLVCRWCNIAPMSRAKMCLAPLLEFFLKHVDYFFFSSGSITIWKDCRHSIRNLIKIPCCWGTACTGTGTAEAEAAAAASSHGRGAGGGGKLALSPVDIFAKSSRLRCFESLAAGASLFHRRRQGWRPRIRGGCSCTGGALFSCVVDIVAGGTCSAVLWRSRPTNPYYY